MPSTFSLDWPYAYGKPLGVATFKSLPEDFIVHEDLGFEPSGVGEHVYLHIEKRGQNTLWVARQVAQFAGVKPNDVGYAGLKDRHALTRQWLSVYLPRDPGLQWQTLNIEGTTLLAVTRHQKKLKAGDHGGNLFSIRLRAVSNHADLLMRATTIAAGVPNYFAEQRFGRDGGNLVLAQSLLVDRKPVKDQKLRGLVISAARSYLFNQVLGARVRAQSWQTLLSGEPAAEPTGPLWGRGRNPSADDALTIETTALNDCNEWCSGLEHVGLQQERRLLNCLPQNLTAEQQGEEWCIRFGLAPGQYATAVLRELVQLQAAEAEEFA